MISTSSVALCALAALFSFSVNCKHVSSDSVSDISERALLLEEHSSSIPCQGPNARS